MIKIERLTRLQISTMAAHNLSDFGSHRKNAYAAAAGYSIAGPYGHTGSQASALRAAPYMSAGNPMMQHAHGDGNLAALANGFGAMSLNSYAAAGRASSQVPATSSDYGGLHMNQSHSMYMPNQSQFLYSGGHMLPGASGTQATSSMNSIGGVYTPVTHYMQPVNYGYAQQMQDHSHQGQTWTPRIASDVSSHGMPTLVTPRRDSVSSNEEHLPATPYTAYGGYHNGITVLDRSPSGVFTHSGTPSPSQFMQSYVPAHMAKHPSTNQIPLALQLLVQQDPQIPRAIPAPSSPMKPLDRCLENKNGETNVYIRGLLPETTDEMLFSWGSRFGDIQSSKSIIDLKTNLCKGCECSILLPTQSSSPYPINPRVLTISRFGFIKYHNFDDAENCIRGFHYLGYEVSFARVSGSPNQAQPRFYVSILHDFNRIRNRSMRSSRSSPTRVTPISMSQTFLAT
jgi:hypothetical protein